MFRSRIIKKATYEHTLTREGGIIKILEIHQYGADGARTTVSNTEFVSGNSPRQISLVDRTALSKARQLPGLCVHKFDADLITGGLIYDSLSSGSRLKIGEMEIEISTERKRCFDECALHQKGETCPLPVNSAFAQVIIGGHIEAGMAITLVTEENMLCIG